MVVALPGIVQPLENDGGEYGAAVHDGQDVRHGLRSPGLRVEDARVGLVVEAVCERRLAGERADLIASVLGDVLEDVSADIKAAEGVEVPGVS
jgi:hypothetical protein